MNLIQALILGILQGLSEFLPISSTAHLTIAGKLMGLINPQNPEQWTAFIAVIQLGTLAAVLVYFSKDIRLIITNFFKENFKTNRKSIKEQSVDSRLGWFIIIGTLPIVTIGLALKKIIEGSLTKDLFLISISLIVLAIILAIAEKTAKFVKETDSITWKDALIVGLAQCFALIPGASRSGTTITAGLFLGIKRETAARFSFLLSIPSVFASGMLEFYQSLKYLTSGDLFILIIATFAAAVSGYVAIAFLLKFLRTKSTFLFVFYRFALGAVILFLLYSKII
ncbi:MAG: undecaprenyl-diphosphatase UppP [Bacteroidota bacterium]